MNKSQRVIVFIIALLILSVIFYFWRGNLLPSSPWMTVIFTSLVMISFVTLFLEHWFTKPSDVLATSISILLVLAPLRNQLRNL